jgi:DNA-binding response OmpR family regulator
MGISNSNLSSYLPVLVVDADQSAADRLVEYLREHGFQAAVATSCWSARVALQNRT